MRRYRPVPPNYANKTLGQNRFACVHGLRMLFSTTSRLGSAPNLHRLQHPPIGRIHRHRHPMAGMAGLTRLYWH